MSRGRPGEDLADARLRKRLRRQARSANAEFDVVHDRRLAELLGEILHPLHRAARQLAWPPTHGMQLLIVDQHDGWRAAASASGHLIVSTGFLQEVSDDAELAGVLAHELAHLTLEHAFEEARVEERVDRGVHRLLKGWLGRISLPISEAVGVGAARAVGRHQETEADAMAVRWAHNAGFDALGLVRFFERNAWTQDHDEGLSLLATHPPVALRAQHLRRQIEAEGLGGGDAGTSVTHRVKARLSAKGRSSPPDWVLAMKDWTSRFAMTTSEAIWSRVPPVVSMLIVVLTVLGLTLVGGAAISNLNETYGRLASFMSVLAGMAFVLLVAELVSRTRLLNRLPGRRCGRPWRPTIRTRREGR